MKFAILFEDNPSADPDIRTKHMPAHLAFLETHRDRIEAAGPLPRFGAGSGGLWIVEAPDAAAAEALVHADPFWPTGLRKSVQVLAWKQVFAGGRRLI
ncbi:YciI family protein [Nisaea acidiphila]|uniref:YciI family protein n=1 Tax=Nisaea acidiphila TaxID=1862145 RepID=A0A9J7ALM4_9PROT|nr:YciI family protein [Nisaea acidiphila]UUX48071.1 YciI family protein [Nisaea acidiphila]